MNKNILEIMDKLQNACEKEELSIALAVVNGKTGHVQVVTGGYVNDIESGIEKIQEQLDDEFDVEMR